MLTRNPRTASAWAAGAIALATVIAYLPVTGAGFVFDDHQFLPDGPILRGPLSDIWFSASAKDYWPLTYTALWIQARLFGDAPLGYHLTNVLLHAATAILLWRVLRALELPGAWLAGLLFAVHPATVESVAWISELKNTLSAPLFLLSVLAWLRAERTGGRRELAAALALFALALLAKTSVVMLPVVLLLLAWYRRGRIDRRDVARTAPFFGVALAAGLATIWFQHVRAMTDGWLPQRGLGERIGGAGWALASYLEAAFVPARLAFVYPQWPVEAASPAFYLPLVALAAGFALLWWGRATWGRPATLALGFHAVMLLPVLGLVDIAYLRFGPVSNHLQYVALMGPVALAAAGLARLAASHRRAAVVAGGAVAVVLAAVTATRAAAFQDDLTLWTAAVRAAPGSLMAHWQLSDELAARGRAAEAIADLEEASRVVRGPASRHRARSLLGLRTGQFAAAVAECDAADALRPDRQFRRDLGRMLTLANAPLEAIATLEPLVRQHPGNVDYRYWLGAALARAGRFADAADVLAEASSIAGGTDAEIEEALSLVRARLGRRP
ncbi:glycosyltransferase family 39 protein [Anaeromyxobacter terrae]|uniref:glycosyltransferase family 39 protein n=1 Tax=Anaeromyxobacter terrae TaxID=2925406 RepID=UPI001F59E389|nr:glycosyltransferase family 39 protein [Anaeromyxobacter sp. SG22]